jgi:HD-like signal output (HDOD) protein
LLKKIIDGEGLPSLSPLVIRLIEIATDDSSSASDLAAIIEKDPGLTIRLLKLVSSTFYARPERVTSIPQAVVLLGFKKVRIMALTLSLRDTFALGKSKGINYDNFWKTSLYRALTAQGFARSAHLLNLDPEEVFVSALILEIGTPMLYEVAYSEDMNESFPEVSLPLEKVISWEEKNLGINHREVGSLVLRRWHFPEYMVESQRCFGSEALKPDTPVLFNILELARRAAEIVFGKTTDLYKLQQLVKYHLKLEHEPVNETLSIAFNKVEDLAGQLRIEVDSQQEILMVMERANQALARINSNMESSLQKLLDQATQNDQSLTRISEQIARGRSEVLQNTLDAVAHEIRNPLLAIGGFANRLAHQTVEEDRGRQYAKIIAQESKRLEDILKEIMEYSQAYKPAFAEKDLVSIVDKVLNEYDNLFRKGNIDIIRDLPQKPLRVTLDINGVVRVLGQLFKNAIDTIGKAHGKLSVSVRNLPQKGQASVCISGNGQPMADEIRDALLDSNLSTKCFGKGLGLPMVRKIIDAHSGRIELDVQEGRKNTVKFYLPISQPF